MALRPVGATIGPADLARRAAPRSGRFAGNRCGASLERDSGRRDVEGCPTDAAVPISRLADMVMESDADLRDVTRRTGLIGPLVGHVGDGNFHYCLAIDVANPEEIKEAKAFAERLAARAIRMGGTCSGEHGIGYGKLHFVEREHGSGAGRIPRFSCDSFPIPPSDSVCSSRSSRMSPSVWRA